jgi:hypothetical protein
MAGRTQCEGYALYKDAGDSLNSISVGLSTLGFGMRGAPLAGLAAEAASYVASLADTHLTGKQTGWRLDVA